MHFLKFNKGMWCRDFRNKVFLLAALYPDGFYLNVNKLSSFAFFRLENDILQAPGYSGFVRMESSKHYVFRTTFSNLYEYIDFIIPVTEDQLIKKIESIIDNAV